MPKNDSTIWRYLTFQKFESMLVRKALYFSAADLLDDPYEGSISQVEFDRRDRDYTQSVVAASKNTGSSFFPMCVMVNCWFRAKRESKAMWDLYGRGSPDALCIKSKLEKLASECERPKRLFYLANGSQKEIDCKKFPEIFVHQIWYYNPHSKRQGDRRHLEYWLRKYTRKAHWFREENEVRALFWYDGCDLHNGIKTSNEHLATILGRSREDQFLANERRYSQFQSERQNARRFKGVFLEVQVSKLIEELVLVPNASHRRQADVRELIRKWGFDIPVRYSDIDVPPRF